MKTTFTTIFSFMRSSMLMCILLFGLSDLQAQTTRNAGTYSELTTAITASADGDIVNITNNIVVTAVLTISNKTITFEGNGYTLTVPVTGLDDAGRFTTSPSNFRVFALSGASKTTTFNNLTIKGGSVGSTGAAIYLTTSHILKMNNCTVSNSRNTSGGGGGISNSGGIVYLKNCEVMRNAAVYGGGFINTSSGKMFVEHSTFSENRSTTANGGGGAGENNGSSTLYVNNSTFSNNKSTEIGGAINNSATVYVMNSSFTGNVAYGSYAGGAIGNNGGTIRAINTLFAYNYRMTSGTSAAPTAYALDDVDAYSGAANVSLYYCILHSTRLTNINQVIGNVAYTGADDGSNNTIFSGGSLSKITDGTGVEIGTANVFQPFLYDNGGIAPTLKSGSFTLQAGNRGTRVGFSNNSTSPVVGYYNRTTSAWITLLGSSPASYEVVTDQVGAARTNPPAIGAIEGTVDNLYMLKVNASADGSVNGGSIYGDVYPSGTSVTLTALPNASRQFVRWDYVLGGTGTASTSNPYTLVVDRNITLVPIFQTVSAGNYSITYSGNGNTGGSAPSTGNYSAATTIAAKGTLTRSGYAFTGWNTNANGSGTSYAAGASYSAANNLNLYAQWAENTWIGTNSTAFATSTNWKASIVPASGDDIVFASNAVNDLILDQDRVAGAIRFSAANAKMVLGNNNLTVTDILGYDAQRYVKTNGTGKLKITVANAQSRIFPVGNSAYNPITIANNSGAGDDFTVQVLDEVYMNGASGTTISYPRVKRTWEIGKASANGGGGIDFTFNWNSGENTSMATPALYHYESGNWRKQSGAGSAAGSSFTFTGYKGTFSPFAIVDEAMSTLPLTWLDFTAARRGTQNLLNWSTANELQVRDFIIQYSTDGAGWQTAGTVAANNNAATISRYQFTHTSPLPGTAYYRLQQRDADGRSSYSRVIRLSDKDEKEELLVYPNPVTDGVLRIKASGESTASLYDSKGVLVLRSNLQAGINSIQVQGLSKGLYHLKTAQQSVQVLIK